MGNFFLYPLDDVTKAHAEKRGKKREADTHLRNTYSPIKRHQAITLKA